MLYFPHNIREPMESNTVVSYDYAAGIGGSSIQCVTVEFHFVDVIGDLKPGTPAHYVQGIIKGCSTKDNIDYQIPFHATRRWTADKLMTGRTIKQAADYLMSDVEITSKIEENIKFANFLIEYRNKVENTHYHPFHELVHMLLNPYIDYCDPKDPCFGSYQVLSDYYPEAWDLDAYKKSYESVVPEKYHTYVKQIIETVHSGVNDMVNEVSKPKDGSYSDTPLIGYLSPYVAKQIDSIVGVEFFLEYCNMLEHPFSRLAVSDYNDGEVVDYVVRIKFGTYKGTASMYYACNIKYSSWDDGSQSIFPVEAKPAFINVFVNPFDDSSRVLDVKSVEYCYD